MFVKEKYGKNQTAGRLVIRRLCLVASEENFLSVTLGSFRSLCSGSAKRTKFECFRSLEALEDCK